MILVIKTFNLYLFWKFKITFKYLLVHCLVIFFSYNQEQLIFYHIFYIFSNKLSSVFYWYIQGLLLSYFFGLRHD